MQQSAMTNALYAIFTDAAIFVAPPLIIASIVAFIVGLFQAITQIQEQTLPQTIKIFVIAFTLAVFGSMLISPFYAMSDQIFTNFHAYEN